MIVHDWSLEVYKDKAYRQLEALKYRTLQFTPTGFLRELAEDFVRVRRKLVEAMEFAIEAGVDVSVKKDVRCVHNHITCEECVFDVGIATISDSIIPYLGEVMLKMPNRGIHLGFIEKWWLVNPLAIIGVLIACFRPTTKFPHMGHVLLSTWASLFHIIMSIGGKSLNWFVYLAIFLFLFLAVWIPCCISDIAFPLLFVKEARRND